MAGIAPNTEFWAGEGSPTSWVVSQNKRRHLSAGQKAMVAAGLKKMFEVEAHARQAHGATAPGKTLPAKMQEALDHGEAVEKAAKLMDVSPRAVYQAQKVLREATPEVIEAVKRGDVSVSGAAAGVKGRKVRPIRSTNYPSIVN